MLSQADQTAIRQCARGTQRVGRLRSANGILSGRIPAAIGDLCQVALTDGEVLAEVVGIRGDEAQMMPFHSCQGLGAGARVTNLSRSCRVPAGDCLLGRVLNGLGQPIDDCGPLPPLAGVSPLRAPPSALQRPRVDQPLITGQRVIDGLNTCGIGQRMAIFAGSGVGKSTLLGEIAKGAEADCCVIALIGERGREVLPFLEDCLGQRGRQRSAVFVATADEPPLMRIRAAQSAVAVAERFRQQGRHVLLMLDSLTRLAAAQREISLLLDEPPSSRGYPPSVFQSLASLLERLGNSQQGAITGMLTVLVEGDDMDDPVADSVRSIVDGHLVLSRSLAEAGHFPAVDVAASLSRVFGDVVSGDQLRAARQVRAAMAVYQEAEDLIRIGAYQAGASPQIDRAVQLRPRIMQFLRQQPDELSTWEQTCQRLAGLAAQWPFE